MWTKHHEKLLKKWGETSKTLAIMHTLSSGHFARRDRRLGIPVVLLGAVTASSIFASANHTTEIVTYINGGLALITTGLTGLARFLNYSELKNSHNMSSNRYQSIAMEIDTILSFPRTERSRCPHEAIDDIRKSINDVRDHSPEVVSWLLEEYLEGYNKSLMRIRSEVNTDEHSAPSSREGSDPPSESREEPRFGVDVQTRMQDVLVESPQHDNFGCDEILALGEDLRTDSDSD
jgi:hypothetical protein